MPSAYAERATHCVVEQALALAQIGAQRGHNSPLGLEAGRAVAHIRGSRLSHWASLTSVLRPGTCLASRAFDQHHLESGAAQAFRRQLSNRRRWTPSRPFARRRNARTNPPTAANRRCRFRTRALAQSPGPGGTAATCILEPISIAAALGCWGEVSLGVASLRFGHDASSRSKRRG